MAEYLVPLNYPRAHDVLRRLSVYTAYTPTGAATALATLRQSYPLIFSRMEEKRFENDAIMLRFAGSGITGPLIFTSHVDAPPCDRILDCPDEMPLSVPLSRAHLVGLLEALEELLRTDYRPSGELILCLSMDGLSGSKGALSMAAHLKQRKITPCFILDYGGYASKEAFRKFLPGDTPLALVGIAEKGEWQGTLTSVRNDPGDRTRPAERMIRAGAAFTRFSARGRLCSATVEMMHALQKRAPIPQRWAAALPQLFYPAMRTIWHKRSVMSQFFLSEMRITSCSAEGDALSLPEEARLTFRQTLVPGANTALLKNKLKAIAKTHHTEIAFWVEQPATADSVIEGEAWDALGTAIEIQFERCVIAPCLCPFPTDARCYGDLSKTVYRFSPYLLTGRQALKGKCTVSGNDLQIAVQFFRSLLSV